MAKKKRPGQPKKAAKRDQRILVLLTPDELVKVEAIAGHERASAWVRRLVFRAAGL